MEGADGCEIVGKGSDVLLGGEINGWGKPFFLFGDEADLDRRCVEFGVRDEPIFGRMEIGVVFTPQERGEEKTEKEKFTHL